MRRANNLLPLIADPDNLLLAFWKAAKGKRNTPEVLAYQEHLSTHIAQLRKDILSGYVTVGDYRYFKVYEPKERQICASAFREQVLHHSLMEVCHPYFERTQIFDSYASRPNKGTHAALERAKQHTLQYEWYLKLDVRKFFESIHHNVLKGQLARLFKEKALLGIFYQIIDSYEASPSRGMPIGNLTSQYFANHFLSGLDWYIKQELSIPAYVRYMDDMVLWHNDKSVLLYAHKAIESFVADRLLGSLKPFTLNRSNHGLPFLGFCVLPQHTRLLRKSSIRYIRQMAKIENNYQSGLWHGAACQRRVLSLVEFTRTADAKVFRQNVLLRQQGHRS